MNNSPDPSEQEPPLHISTLPDEVWALVFSQLSLEELLTCARPVCRRWRAVADARVLSRSLAFGPAAPAKDVFRLLRAAPQLRCLRLENRDDLQRILKELPHLCGELRRLHLGPCRDRLPTDDLTAVLRTCPHITNLTLTGVNLKNRLQFFEELGSLLPNLRTLNLRRTGYYGTELSPLFDSHLQLEGLRVEYFQFTDEACAQLVNKWGNSLQALEIWVGHMTSSGLLALSDCSQLRELGLFSAGKVTGEVLRALAALEHLCALKLGRVGSVPSEVWCQFFSEAPCTSRLWVIGLPECSGVDDRVLSTVAAMCPRLQELDLLSGQGVTGIGVSAVLQGCKRLRHLNLQGCELAVVKAVLTNAEFAYELQILEVCSRDDLAAVVDDLRSDLPRLKVLCGWNDNA